jgi:GT2 family glycosyltransferase
MERPRVSIIILNWNGLRDTLECLASLKIIDYPNYEIIVVDNASSGNDVPEIERHYGDTVRTIVNDQNFGFAKGNNIGIQHVLSENRSDFVLLLNNDTTVEAAFVTELVSAANANPLAAVLGPKMYYYDYRGRRDVICSGAGTINWWVSPGYLQPSKFKKESDLPDESIHKADWVSGACLMINLRKINPILNEKYYFGCEDIDKCIEAKKLGLDVLYVPRSVMWHKVGASRPRALKNKLREFSTSYALMRSHCNYWIITTPFFCITAVTKYLKKKFRRPK